MDKLAYYSKNWHLSAPSLLAETHTSTVYLVERNGKQVVLKLLNEVGVRDELRGAIALQHYDGHGAARLLASSEDAHLLEYLDGDDLLPLVTQGHDDQAAEIIAQVVQALHTAKDTPIPQELHTLQRRFRSLFRLAETNTDPIFMHGAQVAEKLLSNEQNKVVLHGDMHHWNVRQSERGWLAFDPKGLYGENTYDVANALLNPIGMPDITHDEARLLRHVKIYADALKIPSERVLAFAFAHACLSISWSIEDGDDYDEDFTIAKMMQQHLSSMDY